MKQDPVLVDPDGHHPYAKERALDAGLSGEVADLCERIVMAERAVRLTPGDEVAMAEYEAAVAAAQAYNGPRRATGVAVGGDAVRVG